MRIDGSDVTLTSSHALLDERSTTTSLRAWIGQEPTAARSVPAASVALSPDALAAWAAGLTTSAGTGDAARISGRLGALVAAAGSRGRANGAGSPGRAVPDGRMQAPAGAPASLVMPPLMAPEADVLSSVSPASGNLDTPGTDDPKLRLLILIIERLTGRRVKLLRADDIQPDRCAKLEQARETARAAVAQSAGSRAQDSGPVGWGVEVEAHAVHREAESTTVAASGTVVTDDGREIRFQLDTSMTRTSEERQDLSVRLGDAVRLKDPLVVNLDGGPVQLTADTVQFDLNTDGTAETISFVAPGSAFLALDRNGDGRVSDGSELFGAQTGNGFAELATFDGDGNGWIDQGDAVYGTLKLWSRDAAGTESLAGLADAGVGAICLGSVASPFALKDTRNELVGAVRSTGVYLREGSAGAVTAGSIQQIDLVA
jgi:hypothetical protein